MDFLGLPTTIGNLSVVNRILDNAADQRGIFTIIPRDLMNTMIFPPE